MVLALIPIVLFALAVPSAATALPQEAPPATSQQDTLKSGGTVPDGAVAMVDGIPVPTSLFVHEMTNRYLRPGAKGHPVLESMEQEALITAALRRRGLSVTDEDVATKVRAIKEEFERKSPGTSFETVCRDNNVTPEMFAAKARGVVALEKLARAQFKIPDDKPVEKLKLDTWLQDARESAKIERDRSKLRSEYASRVDDEPILSSAFIALLISTLDASEVRKNVDTLIQEIIVGKLLAGQKIALTEADIQGEWDYKAKEFNADPSHKGIPFADIVRQQTGLERAEFVASRGFRVNASVAKLAKVLFTEEEIATAFEKHKALYGPRYHARHILLRASDHPNLKGKLHTFAECEELARFIANKAKEGTAFEDLAKQYSEDTGTRSAGGVIPPFTPGRNNYETKLVEACLALKPYEVSEPIRGASGWHVIRLDAIDPIPPMAEVDADLRRVLSTEYFKAAYDKAVISVDIQKALGITGVR